MLLLTLLLLCAPPPPAGAATKTWDGSINDLWSVALNWEGSVAPVDGDDLVFPSGTPRRVITNDISGLDVRSVTFTGDGYAIRGNSISLTDGLRCEQASGLIEFYVTVTLGASQTFDCIHSDANMLIGHIHADTNTLTINGSGTTRLRGWIIGNGGRLVKDGTGMCHLEGDGYVVVTTTVRLGRLFLNKSEGFAIRGPLVIGDGAGVARVTCLSSDNIDHMPVTINRLGLLDLNGHSEAVGALTLDGGEITTDAGTLTLTAKLTAIETDPANTWCYIYGNLILGAAFRTFDVSNPLRVYATVTGGGLIKTGPKAMYLNGPNAYGGLTIIQEGGLWAENHLALGTTASGTVVSNAATLTLYGGVGITNEPLSLNGVGLPAHGFDYGALTAIYGSNIWAGPITLNADATMETRGASTVMQIIGAVGGAGGLTKFGEGTLVLAGSSGNSYNGDTCVQEGVLELSKAVGAAVAQGVLTIGDGVGDARADVVRAAASDQIGNIPVVINSSGLLDLKAYDDAIGSLTMNGGDVTSGTGLLTLGGNLTANASSELAEISGYLSLGGVTRTFDVANSVLDPDLVIAAVIAGGGITKTGKGTVRFDAANTYAGLTTINSGAVLLHHASGLGQGHSGAGTVLNGGQLSLGGVIVAGESLTNKSSASLFQADGASGWTSNVVLNAELEVQVPSGTLNLSGALSGPGGLTKNGMGTLIFSGNAANTCGGGTRVNSGILTLRKSLLDSSIRGDLIIGDGVGGAGADVVRVEGSGQIHDHAAVTVNSSGTLDVSGVSANEIIGSLAGSGQVVLGSQRLDAGQNDASTSFSGLISGAGGSFYKQGLGTMTLGGDNTYSGETTVLQGTLLINGSQPASLAGTLPGATLGGTGTVGDIIAYGVISPGTSPGMFTCSNLTLNASSTFRMRVDGVLQPGTLVIEASTDLAGWVPAFTNTTPTNVLFYTDPDAGGHLWRFYRAFQFP